MHCLSLSGNRLTGTLPSSLSALTNMDIIHVFGNSLTGPVPALPFKQYKVQGAGCCLSDYNHHQPDNKWTCPLPVGSADCKCNGAAGVFCN
jgi:hypothetical protein